MIPPCAANVISPGPPNSCWPLAMVFMFIGPVSAVGVCCIPTGPASLDAGFITVGFVILLKFSLSVFIFSASISLPGNSPSLI